ncbi:hypothetical protein C7974DRAFT_446629 [Boeremia exigua]|uniref:uncharacterized protein n=1 Tax=Boeremia exigua TaxID=749465 RepID=UPI001E8E2688|nr:uncharacterized protein C7974DRAFT_446629 [Boeremia exigua]KAH6642224.1 hypothetical protein C7974DRAFT_446629 [Boeremia exigua]
MLLPLTCAFYRESLPAPADTGIAFALLFRFAAALPAFIYQCPTNTEVNAFYANDVTAFSQQLATLFQFTAKPPIFVLYELSNLVVETLGERFPFLDDESAQTERLLLLTRNLPNNAKLELLQQDTWQTTLICLNILIDTHLPLFRARWSDAAFNSFATSFSHTLTCSATLTPPLLPTPDLNPLDCMDYFLFDVAPTATGRAAPTASTLDYDSDSSDDSDIFLPTGPRIPLSAFCLPIPAHSPLMADACAICAAPVATLPPGDEAAVTACGHAFHAECLASWVNDAAAANSNTCPACRAVMCKARERVLVHRFEEADEREIELLRYVREAQGWELGVGRSR